MRLGQSAVLHVLSGGAGEGSHRAAICIKVWHMQLIMWRACHSVMIANDCVSGLRIYEAMLPVVIRRVHVRLREPRLGCPAAAWDVSRARVPREQRFLLRLVSAQVVLCSSIPDGF